MNKYQEALDRLNHNAYQSVENEFRYGCGTIDKNEIRQHHEDVWLMKELVDRAIPMKPIYEPQALGRGYKQWCCPKCYCEYTGHDHCWNCGQALGQKE